MNKTADNFFEKRSNVVGGGVTLIGSKLIEEGQVKMKKHVREGIFLKEKKTTGVISHDFFN